jgi:hypothetical protein
MIRVVVAAIVGVLYIAGTAGAQKPAIVYGAGGLSCGAYVLAYDEYRPFRESNSGGLPAWSAALKYKQFELWIEGCLSGVDSWNPKQVRQFDEAGLELWIYKYCRSHPIDVVINAALAFYRFLGGPAPIGGDRAN